MIKPSRILGVAFLLQFVTSFSSGVFVQPLWLVPGDIGATMLNIAENVALMRANILLDMLTALGIIFLGAMLFVSLRKVNEKAALVALGFYIVEAAVLAASKGDTFSLLRMSQEYAAAGQPAYLETMAGVALEAMDFVGFQIHMLVFCPGAILFYYLLYRSRIVPRALSLWGLITVLPLLVATVLGIFEVEVPFVVALPYVPFEFVIGLWILIRGTDEATASNRSPVLAGEMR
ncbi:MAG: DUF4386 domain-containing protein [Anaerolineae bacterium]|nr:DUF4386 domain-containing protein [Anaerolineae bacterium]